MAGGCARQQSLVHSDAPAQTSQIDMESSSDLPQQLSQHVTASSCISISSDSSSESDSDLEMLSDPDDSLLHRPGQQPDLNRTYSITNLSEYEIESVQGADVQVHKQAQAVS